MHFNSGKVTDIFDYSNEYVYNNDDNLSEEEKLEDLGISNYNIIPFNSNLIESIIESEKNIHLPPSNDNLLSFQIKKNESKIPNKEEAKEKEKQITPSNLFIPIQNESYFENNNNRLGNANNKSETIKKQNDVKIEIKKNEEKKQNNYLNQKRRNESRKKTGRKTNKIKSEYSHTKNDFDNIQLKIQVHFLNFLIDISNDVLRTELGKDYEYNFIHINYKSKQNIKFDYVEELKSNSIKNILQKDINERFKTLKKEYNKELLEKVCLQSTRLDNFFNINFCVAFEEYYYNYYNKNKMINKINFEGKDITLSKNTKCFYDLIEKNKDLENKLVDTAKKVYMKNSNIFDFKQMLKNRF